MNLGPMEIGLILLAILLLFGYKKLPDASRSLGRSLRIFKGEMKGMKEDDGPGDVPATPARAEVLPAPVVADREAADRAAAVRGSAHLAPSAGADSAR